MKNSNNSHFFILKPNFHHEVGLIQRRYSEFFFSIWSILSSYNKSAPNETDSNLFLNICFHFSKKRVSMSSDFFCAKYGSGLTFHAILRGCVISSYFLQNSLITGCVLVKKKSTARVNISLKCASIGDRDISPVGDVLLVKKV